MISHSDLQVVYAVIVPLNRVYKRWAFDAPDAALDCTAFINSVLAVGVSPLAVSVENGQEVRFLFSSYAEMLDVTLTISSVLDLLCLIN